VKCIMQFKASKADFNQFVENRMELIFSHLWRDLAIFDKNQLYDMNIPKDRY
jgi:hypothetical protein